ncbi:unnamed protein product [Ceutorhynchus assimilis]|uniref:Uncharacterized protein n=1 Tax=Ceutorhynchus assimilis TaxID=467358 RepID=A0A9N9QIA3_9CUCU|nr:unnamed protein product [Ceutorhynchus assimilis]
MKFKCHRSQDIHFLICVTCYSVAHKSCQERLKNWIHLNDHKMYCSRACQEDAKINENLLENAQLLKKENEELLQALEQKDNYIKRTIAIKEQINTDAIEMEEFFTRQLEERKSQMNLLESQKSELQRTIVLMQKPKANCSTQTTTINKTDSYIQTESAKMVTSASQTTIETETVINTQVGQTEQEQETACQTTRAPIEETTNEIDCEVKPEEDSLYTELLTAQLLRIQIDKEIQTADCQKTGYSTKEINTTERVVEKVPQIVILGDYTIKGSMQILRRLRNERYDTNCQYNHISNEEIITKSRALSQNLSLKDHIIIFLTQKDIIRGKTLTQKLLQELILTAEHTNVLVVGSLFARKEKIALNKMIQNQNDQTKLYLSNLNIDFEDPNNIQDCNYTGRFDWKFNLMVKVCNKYINTKHHDFNKEVERRLQALTKKAPQTKRDINILQNITITPTYTEKNIPQNKTQTMKQITTSTPNKNFWKARQIRHWR